MISVWEFFPLLEDYVPIAVCETKAEGDAIVAKRAALYPGPHYPGAVIVEREMQFMERLKGIGHRRCLRLGVGPSRAIKRKG